MSAGVVLGDREFAMLQRLMFDVAGIHIAATKKVMVAGRLAKRLKARNMSSYSEYCRLLASGTDQAELQCAIDLLTTNETYFFREPKHFEFLSERVLAQHRPGQPFRVWSAACSSGEEPFSVAMLLADRLGETDSRVLASDLSTQVLAKASTGLYPIGAAERIPQAFLKRYCLKGVGEQDGTLLIGRELRQRVEFRQINLNMPLPRLGPFDVIFLRNVMIYFPVDVKKQVVARVAEQLKPGGFLFIGHSESLHGLDHGLESVQPAIYRRPA